MPKHTVGNATQIIPMPENRTLQIIPLISILLVNHIYTKFYRIRFVIIAKDIRSKSQRSRTTINLNTKPNIAVRECRDSLMRPP